MNTTVLEELITIVKAEDNNAAIDWALALAVEDKKWLSSLLVDELKNRFREKPKSLPIMSAVNFENRWQKAYILQICFFVTASLSQLKAQPIYIYHLLPETLLSILAKYQPPWLDNWTNWFIEQTPRAYKEVQAMVKAGYCSKPSSDNYILGMLLAFGRDSYHSGKTTAELVLDNPDVLENDIWRLFEIEGNGEFSLGAHDKYTLETNTWSYTLKHLSEQGHISRSRLLDSALSALDKDFAQFRAGWYSRFFTYLSPSIDELVQRQSALLFLLASHIPPTVSFTVKQLQVLNKHNRLDYAAFLSAVEPALTGKVKATSLALLKLIEQGIKHHPKLQNHALVMVTKALYYDNADVQKKVFDLLDKHTKDKQQIAGALAELQDFVLPSQRDRLSAWLNRAEAPDSSNDNVVNEIISPESVVPIATFEELVKQWLQLLEKPDDPIQIEQALNGLITLGIAPPANAKALTAPLKARAKKLSQNWSSMALQAPLAKLILSYLQNKNEFSQDMLKGNWNAFDEVPYFQRVFHYRLSHIADQVLANEKNAPNLLSLPTDTLGRIDANILFERIQTHSKQTDFPPLIEQVLSLYRLDIQSLNSSQRHRLAKQYLSIDIEFSHACAYALGADVNVGSSGPLWFAAAMQRENNKVTPAFAEAFPNMLAYITKALHFSPYVRDRQQNHGYLSLDVNVSPSLLRFNEIEYLALLFHVHAEPKNYHCSIGSSDDLIKWCSTVWPSNLEPFFCGAAIFVDLLEGVPQPYMNSYFEPLFYHCVPFTPMAALLIMAGISTKDPGVSGVATELLIQVLSDGRYKQQHFSSTLSYLMTSELLVVKRWTKALAQISNISKLHSLTIKQLIESILTFEPDKAPRDFGSLLELLYELCIDLGESITESEALTFLAANTKGGKQKTYCSKLFKLSAS